MPTPGERQALLFVAIVASLGVGVRAWRAIDRAPQDPTARSALAGQIARVDSAIAAGGARTKARKVPRVVARPPAKARERVAPSPEPAPTPLSVDVDLATAEDLARLPGIGPALAARIIEDRERRGPFGSLEALDGVKGIGPALLDRLRPHVTFSQPPRPPDTEAPAPRPRRRP